MDAKPQTAATVDIGTETRERLRAYVNEPGRNLKLGATAAKIIGQYLDRIDARKARLTGR
jgi:hypothetical protein